MARKSDTLDPQKLRELANTLEKRREWEATERRYALRGDEQGLKRTARNLPNWRKAEAVQVGELIGALYADYGNGFGLIVAPSQED
jgi:hypothetical protein